MPDPAWDHGVMFASRDGCLQRQDGLGSGEDDGQIRCTGVGPPR